MEGEDRMFVKRITLISITFIIMITLLFIGFNTIIAGVITLVIVMIGYIAIAYKRSMKRLYLLDEVCDPEAFLKSTERQEAITGRNIKLATIFTIDKAAALITLGEYEQAKNLLEAVDQSKIPGKNNALLVYTINLIVCYYELGDISQAERLFETQISILAPTNQRVKKAVNILVGERYYFLGKYDESGEHLSKILESKLSRRVRLCILFRLAQIDEIKGNIDQAKEKYLQVVEQGNKLQIVEDARIRLRGLK